MDKIQNNIKILIIANIDKTIYKKLETQFSLTYKPQIHQEELDLMIDQFDILIIGTYINFDNERLSKAKKLKLLIRMGIGVDHIDLNFCKVNNILVCNTPSANTTSVVEIVYSQLIRYLRALEKSEQNLIKNNFRSQLKESEELDNKTIGIIGVGRIGSKVAKIAKILGMQTIGYDIYLRCEEMTERSIDVVCSSIDQLIKKSDIITFHVPLTAKTRYMADANFFNKIKSPAIIINTARGKIIKFIDLLDAVKNNKIKHAILDVYEDEPFYIQKIPIELQDRFSLTPHIGALTTTSLSKRSLECYNTINSFINNEKIENIIDYDKGF